MVAIATRTQPALATPGGVRLVAVEPRPGLLAADSPLVVHRSRIAWALGTLVAVLALAVLVLSPVGAATPPTTSTHVVGTGETMWSIAVDVAPAGEAAGYVERLIAANGDAVVTPGEVLVLPRP